MRKLKGWFIYNRSLDSSPFKQNISYFQQSFLKENLEVSFLHNQEIVSKIGYTNKRNKDIDFVLFWDKDIHLAYHLESLGYRLFNSSRSIELCDNKIFTQQTLSNHSITIPKTIPYPLIFNDEIPLPFLKEVAKELQYPLIVKEAYGSFGQQVYMVHTFDELIMKVKELNGKQFLFQEFIQSSYGKDIRVQVVGNEVVASMLRESTTSFISNISFGGKPKKYTLSAEEERIAIDSIHALSLDFGGVDILFGENGPIVCEVNSNARFIPLYETTGVMTTDYIARYIKNTLK